MSRFAYLLVAAALVATGWWYHSSGRMDNEPPRALKNKLLVEPDEPLSPGASDTSLDQKAGANKKRLINAPSITITSIIDDSASFKEAIGLARDQFGTNDPRVHELERLADSLCKRNPDPWNATDPNRPDQSRIWAIARHVELCADLPDKLANSMSQGQIDIELARKKGGSEAALIEANAVIRDYDDVFSQVSAGLVLLEFDAIPLDRLLPEHASRYGHKDLVDALPLAIYLANCTGDGGCGPRSLPTVMFCQIHGCAEGSTFDQALRARLSEHQLNAVLALQSWIREMKRESGRT